MSDIACFGEPVYSYSLKQGIRDGFLAPYMVVKVRIYNIRNPYVGEEDYGDPASILAELIAADTGDFKALLEFVGEGRRE